MQQVYCALPDAFCAIGQFYFHYIEVYAYGLQFSFLFAIPPGAYVTAFINELTPLVKYFHIDTGYNIAVSPEEFVLTIAIWCKGIGNKYLVGKRGTGCLTNGTVATAFYPQRNYADGYLLNRLQVYNAVVGTHTA